MPSEKSKYLNRNCSPESPFSFDELKAHLPSLGIDLLTDILYERAQSDDILAKTLIVSVAIRLAQEENFEAVKSAVDYALHFSDYIRYSENGHDMILEEIKGSLEYLVTKNRSEFAVRVANYTIERAQDVSENFEDDWSWNMSINSLLEWTTGV